MSDAEIVKVFDNKLEAIIEDLASKSGRDFAEVIKLLQLKRS